MFKSILVLFSSFTISQLASSVSTARVPELITRRGYPCEQHPIVTHDRYILTLFRIKPKTPGPPVIMQHGILNSASVWVIGTPHKSAGFLLADAGYDVWLPNLRGNLYSRNHTYLDPEMGKFWDFSWDEMAQFDFPAIVTYVLKVTGYPQLHYIGYSMGSTIFFAGMDYHPQLNSKIKSMYAIGPVSNMAYIRTNVRFLSLAEESIKIFMEATGHYEIGGQSDSVKNFFLSHCNEFETTRVLCIQLASFLLGPDYEYNDPSWVTLAMEDGLISGTSISTVVHYGQVYLSKKFRRFDYGLFGNLRNYGVISPPAFDLKSVTCRVNLIWGQNDYLAGPKDADYLLENLPNIGPVTGAVEDDNFNHIDFILSPLAKELIYDKIIRDMNLQ